MNEIIGAIYPIPTKLVDRLFDGKTKVFVKYTAQRALMGNDDCYFMYADNLNSNSKMDSGARETLQHPFAK